MSNNLEQACRIVGEHYYPDRSLWCYDAFNWINETLFLGELPFPLILIELTPHGGCVGFTHAPDGRPPIICLHPSLWGGTEKPDPWRILPDLLGPRYALDTLIHECIHVSVHYRLHGPSAGDSSHNNPEWIAEVNRIAPLIRLPGVQAAMSKPKRIEKKIRRVSEGNIPFDHAAKFPHPVRIARGEAGYYRDKSPLPFESPGVLRATARNGMPELSRRATGDGSLKGGTPHAGTR